MTVNELISDLQIIKDGMGGSLPVIVQIKVIRRVTVDCECDEGCHEEKTTEIGESEIASVSSEMVPPNRGDSKRKVVLR